MKQRKEKCVRLLMDGWWIVSGWQEPKKEKNGKQNDDKQKRLTNQMMPSHSNDQLNAVECSCPLPSGTLR